MEDLITGGILPDEEHATTIALILHVCEHHIPNHVQSMHDAPQILFDSFLPCIPAVVCSIRAERPSLTQDRQHGFNQHGAKFINHLFLFSNSKFFQALPPVLSCTKRCYHSCYQQFNNEIEPLASASATSSACSCSSILTRPLQYCVASDQLDSWLSIREGCNFNSNS